MGNHPFNFVVVLFWLATMSWLVVAKVLPPLRVGEPPNYTAILKESRDEEVPVCWSIRLQDRTIGWAANKIERRNDGTTDLFSRVYLGEFPLEEIAPAWLGTVLKGMLANLGAMDLDKRSRVMVDPLGRLVGFESRMRLGSFTDALKVLGQVEGTTLKLSVQSGNSNDFPPYKKDAYLPPNALLSDDLSPQSRMPGLRVGQTWTVPLYSPFRSPNSPLEILQAQVEREDKISWDGKSVNCRVIVYRGDPGSGLGGTATRARAWVREDGVVLHQEVSILRSRLHFVRLTDEPSRTISEALGEDWTSVLPSRAARRVLRQLHPDGP